MNVYNDNKLSKNDNKLLKNRKYSANMKARKRKERNLLRREHYDRKNFT